MYGVVPASSSCLLCHLSGPWVPDRVPLSPLCSRLWKPAYWFFLAFLKSSFFFPAVALMLIEPVGQQCLTTALAAFAFHLMCYCSDISHSPNYCVLLSSHVSCTWRRNTIKYLLKIGHFTFSSENAVPVFALGCPWFYVFSCKWKAGHSYKEMSECTVSIRLNFCKFCTCLLTQLC